MAFTVPTLSYNFAALEPHIDARTMEIHHDKHHGTYVTKLNEALASSAKLQKLTIEELMMQLEDLPEAIRTAVRNNGGGHYNHTMFWTSMGPHGGGAPTDSLQRAIDGTFGDFEKFKTAFSQAGINRFGSGWAWLMVDPQGHLQIVSCPNQDNPLMDHSGTPILGLDVWEHAYYLNYQNRRPDYINAWWNVVDWSEIGKRFVSAKEMLSK